MGRCGMKRYELKMTVVIEVIDARSVLSVSADVLRDLGDQPFLGMCVTSASVDSMTELQEMSVEVTDHEDASGWVQLNGALPTEPGWYLFSDDDGNAPDLLNLNPNHWPKTNGWNDNFRDINPLGEGWGYTQYMAIPEPPVRGTKEQS